MARPRTAHRPGPEVLRSLAAALGAAVLAAAVLAGGSGPAWAGDWPYFRHDPLGTSNAGEPFTAAQARRLAVKWQAATIPIGSPVVASGTVYITDGPRSLVALDEATGAEKWNHDSRIYGPFHCFPQSTSNDWLGPIGSPAVVGERVFQPGGNGVVYAHDTQSGAVLWETPIANVPERGEFLWSSPFPLGDRIYVGVASLHDCLLAAGRVVALDQATGAVVGTWWADAEQGPGGGVWSRQAYDARTDRLFVATGTIALGKSAAEQPLAQAIVAIDPLTMETLDSFSPITADYYDDFDFGTSPVLYDTPDGRHLIAATNKNGTVYALDRDNLAGGVVWSYQISGPGVSPDEGEGSIVSPAYADGVLFVGGGRTLDGHPGAFAALDAATGATLWLQNPANGGFVLAAPVVTGEAVIYASTHAGGGNATVYVVCQSNGALLFSMETPNAIFAAPTFANGVLYFGDLGTATWALATDPDALPPPGGEADPCQLGSGTDGGVAAADTGPAADGGPGAEGGVAADAAAARDDEGGDAGSPPAGGCHLAAGARPEGSAAASLLLSLLPLLCAARRRRPRAFRR